MKALIACEFSEVVKEQFLIRGHEAHSCDYLPGEKGLPNHHQCDVRDLLKFYKGYFDMLIGHPDCTFLANSGVRWLVDNPERYHKMMEACEFFNLLLNVDIPLIALENPIQHGYARQYIRKYDQIIQPWQFGHGETKATCFWLKGLPLLQETNRAGGRQGRVWREPPSPERQKNRSRTYHGIAEAMAEQWGKFVPLEIK